MLTERSSLQAEKAEKYRDMLSKHFARKVQVDNDQQISRVHFPMGFCTLCAESEQLHFICEADSQAALDAVKSIIDKHINLLKEVRGTELHWQTV